VIGNSKTRNGIPTVHQQEARGMHILFAKLSSIVRELLVIFPGSSKLLGCSPSFKYAFVMIDFSIASKGGSVLELDKKGCRLQRKED
jgi:hypothetical protein